jgi:hypothetical protein
MEELSSGFNVPVLPRFTDEAIDISVDELEP